MPAFRSCVGIVFISAIAVTAQAAEPSRPRLAVVVVFDQMRGDYLTRWQDLFGKDGFRRLETGGAWFQNCNYPYSNTVTAAGHASMSTGTTPAHHGIIGNDWYDRDSAKGVTSVSSDRYMRVPAPRGDRKVHGASPDRLATPTIGDLLKQATAGRAHVIGVSLKDRSAILLAGRHADGCYWLDHETGNFITSTFYRDQLPAWAADFNRAHSVDRWLGQKWTHLLPEVDYARYSSPDDTVGEGVGIGQGRAFPHPFPAGKPNARYYAAVFNSPFGNDVLLDFVNAAISGEHLGQHDVPDLLCVSFSSNDSVGHCWGPDSQEVMDVTLRSDLIVRGLLKVLDARVGKGQYVLALSADHGVCPVPEVERQRGRDAGRISPRLLSANAEAFLEGKFGKDARWIQATAEWWVYLNQDAVKAHGLKSATVEAALADWLKGQPGLQGAYTRTRLSGTLAADDRLGRMVQQSYYPSRSGDVYVLVKPYYLVSSEQTGTTHGTPYPYDTHVPLLVHGPGIRPGIRSDAVTPQAIASILSRELRIPAPPGAPAVPDGLFAR